MNPQFVVLGAFSSQSSRTFFHVFPELSRSIVNAVPGEISDRRARLELPHQRQGEQALPREATVQEVTSQIDSRLWTEGRCFLERHVENVSPWTLG